MAEGRLSGKRWNRLLDHALTYYQTQVDRLTEAVLDDGYPPFAAPLSPAQQFQRLQAWRVTGDARYWQDESAQKAWTRLAMRFAADEPLLPLATGTYPGGMING